MLIVQPIGGLCNRIRSMNSACSLARAKKVPLLIIWMMSEELNCPFEKLFKKMDSLRIVSIRSKFHPAKLFWQFTSHYLNNEEIRPYKITVNDLLPASDFFDKLSGQIYIATEECFYPSVDYQSFEPASHLLPKINSITSQFTPNTFGVHIRRTDNLLARNRSTTEDFIRLMHKKTECFADANFYLATDDLLEEALICKEFPGRILSNKERILKRNTPAGMEDAMIDLYCLSHTTSIIGSYYSSFSDVAAKIGQIPLEIAADSEI